MELVDVTHALFLEGADPSVRHEGDAMLEQMGHDVRAAADPVYKRATWGRRPEDIAAQEAVVGDMAGRR